MCRDVSVSVTQQNLAGFVWHTSGSKTPTKCMLQIMHPSLSEIGPLSGSLPPIIVNRRHWMPLVCKYKLGVCPALTINPERVNLKWTVCFKLIVNFLELPEALGS